jgi:lysophospholipase L1-like esterase
LRYIDVTPVMHDSDGTLKESLFGRDRLHMTQAGYDAWTPIIERALRQ